MKKYIILIISIFMIIGCNNKTYQDNLGSNKVDERENITNMETDKISITINDQKYAIILENNDTARAFVNLLPKTFNMRELNGNEKYIYIDDILPTNASNPKHIVAGDVMLYGDNCLVIFYKSFNTSYSYTKIGHIDGLPDLGKSDIAVILEK